MRTPESPSAGESDALVGFGTEILADPRAAEELGRLAEQFGTRARIILPS